MPPKIMAGTSVDTIQSRIASILDQDQDTGNISTDDYALRLAYINRREQMWAEVGKWRCLLKEFNTLTSTNTANTSISLPADFRSLAAYPKITYDGTTTSEFTEISLTEQDRFDPTVDKYVMILGNSQSGYTMVGSYGQSTTAWASGASIKIPYYSIPTSHASPANVVFCPNPDYLVQGVIADVWEAREDARYQQAKVEANLILQNMMEFENTPSEAAYNKQVKTIDEINYAFRWGK